MNEEYEDSIKKEFEETAKKIQDFTTILNKYNLEYEVAMWGNGEGYDILIDDCIISFANAGRISFEVNEDKLEQEKKDEQ